MNSAARTWMQRGVILTLWIAAFALWQNYRSTNDLSSLEAGQRFIDTIEAAWWGIFAFIGVYLIRPLVLFPASVLTVMGGVVFGPWVGVLVVVVAANASALVAYGVGRLLGGTPGVEPDTAPEAMSAATPGVLPDETESFAARWAGRLRENSFETVFVMRLIFLPYDLVNYLCGALRIRWTSFLLATALGSLPGTISFVLLGASLERIDTGIDGINPIAIVFSVALFIISVAISRVVKRRQQIDASTISSETHHVTEPA